MTTTPEVVLFDVMDTLVRDPFFHEVADFFGCSLEELLAAKSADAWPEFETGRIDEETYARRAFKDGRDYDHAGMRAVMLDGYAWIEGMEELLTELSGRGVAMHALSNYPEWFRMLDDKLGVSRYVPWTFVSCRTGVRKPSAEAYLGAATALGVEPGRCLFVDDRDGNVSAARAVGMAALRFEDAASLRDELRRLGLL
jgi:HAD superfamily hydrolase (TIGR01509 family)